MENNFLPEGTPILDTESENFKEDLAFNLWSTQSCSDYRNDRDRPYNGQPHTDDGERGKTEVKGLTMRDVRDCLIRAMLISSPNKEYTEFEEWKKCWDYSDGGEGKPTQYLMDNQDKYVSAKVELGTWRPQDVYKIKWDDVDPLAIANNLTCEIEKLMNIFSNLKPLNP